LLELKSVERVSSPYKNQVLAEFCESYWPPPYAFLRHRRYSSADAQDLVQGFFGHLLAHGALSRADRERGRLRTFLFSSLQNS
jgi:RNA polymerase sigma-70 factor (ECF subfamily)